MIPSVTFHQSIHYEYLTEGIHSYTYCQPDTNALEQMVLHLAKLYAQPPKEAMRVLHNVEQITITPYMYQLGVEMRRVTNIRQGFTAYVLNHHMLATIVPKIRAELPHKTTFHQREAFLTRADAIQWLLSDGTLSHNSATQLNAQAP